MRYLPGLNTLRTYAALAVVLEHVPGFAREWFGVNVDSSPLLLFFIDEWSAVTLFFTLSGFLITYLLMRERAQTGTITLSKFYLRRAARIYPLYYAVFALTVLVVGAFPPTVTALTLALLPNVALTMFPLGAIAHLWSIGVEEQFYFAHPFLLKRLKSVFIVAFLLIAIRWIGLGVWYEFFRWCRFDAMAVGCIFGYLAYRNAPALRVLSNKVSQAYILLAVALVAIWTPARTPVMDLALSVVFAALIYNVSVNPRKLINIEHPIMRTLGDASYGIYMLHPLVAYLAIPLLPSVLTVHGVALITVGVALASRKWYEEPFLRLKERRFTPSAPSRPRVAAGD